MRGSLRLLGELFADGSLRICSTDSEVAAERMQKHDSLRLGERLPGHGEKQQNHAEKQPKSHVLAQR